MDQATAEQVEQALNVIANALASKQVSLQEHQQYQQALGLVATAARASVVPTNGDRPVAQIPTDG